MEYFNECHGKLDGLLTTIGNRFDSSDEPFADGFQTLS